MYEEMDTSSSDLPGETAESNAADSGPNIAMDVSPILDRRSTRSFQSTPRNLASSSGWINTRIQPTTSHISAQVHVQATASFNTEAVQPSVQLLAPNVAQHEPQPLPRPLPSEALGNTLITTPQPIDIGAAEVITIHRSGRVDNNISEQQPLEDVNVGDVEAAGANESIIIEEDEMNIPEAGASSPNTEHVQVQVQVQVQGGETESAEQRENAQTTSGLHAESVLPPFPDNINHASPEAPQQDSERTAIIVENTLSNDVENVPLAQRIRSPEASPSKSPPPPKKPKQEVEAKADDSDGEDEGKLCPICFDLWTNSGEHRLVALRCGHLFGQRCIQHWLQIHKANDRRCPQCKKKASVKDIRHLYASKIRVLDTSEQEQLKESIKKLEVERDRLSRELAYERQLNQESIRIQREQQMKIQQLQNQGLLLQQQPNPSGESSKQATALAQLRINMTHRVEVSREGGCRVLAFNEWKGVLVASQSSTNPLFPDFGVRMIDTPEFRLRQLMPLHSKAIRDLAFNEHRKDLLLSVSLDRTAKIFCMSTNSTTMNFNTEVPLWSCCWDGDNPNIFFAGSQNGIVLQYDIRNAHTEVSRVVTQGDMAPVIALAGVPSGGWLPRGGFISCRLNRLRVCERTGHSADFLCSPMNIEGPFSALSYDYKTEHMLLSTRPTAQSPHAQHQFYQMTSRGSKPQSNLIHSFLGGTSQRVMSRPCQLHVDGTVKDTLVCAHQESEGNVAVWSVGSGQKVPAGPLPCSEPVMDLCPLKINNRTYLASLSEKSLRVYQFS